MLAQRLIVAIFILPVLVLLAYTGGWILSISIAATLGFAAWEYYKLFSSGGFQPVLFILVAGTVILVLARHAFAFQSSDLYISLVLMTAMAWQVIRFERGISTSAVDFGITLGGLLYLGWLGSYIISLRDLPDGLWWSLVVIPTISISDAGAYFIGSHFGKHKISQRISPNKSWEGYFGGIVTGTLGAVALAALWHLRAPIITIEKGLILGLAITIFSPLGDLGESMLKRSFGVKDSSRLLPGHGGIMDRIDSWLWAAPIGYYVITLLLS
ncbi:MAG: phosphatidate cytidylyltransferase [Anaerolineaceae bacterium]|nr:phosphatidate cytidylyltransferase [Anaerolineaceae bacterium]